MTHRGRSTAVPRFRSPQLSAVLWALACLALSGSLLSPRHVEAQPAGASGKFIRKITVEGLLRTAESEVLGRMQIRVGERYDRNTVEKEAGRLFAIGHFSRVRGPFVTEFDDGLAIRFVVVEKPLILRVQFRGIDEFSDNELLDGTPPMRTREGELFNRYLARQDEDLIREMYLEDGYLFVTVTHEITNTERGVVVTFRVSEGTRIRVSEIRFLGNRSIPDGDLLSLMEPREKDQWLFGLIRPGFFNYRDLRADMVAIKRHYRSFGFLDARAEPETIQPDPIKERMVLTIRIDEGPRYTFRGYRFQGNSVFSDRALYDLTTAPVGKPYNQEQMERDRLTILNYYKDRAYIFAEVNREFQYAETGTEAFLLFKIVENNEIHINEIRVKGNLKTQDRVVRRELEFYPGERIDNSKLVKSRSNLARLGIFQDIQYTYEQTGTPSSRDLIVNVQEAGRGQIIFGIGITNHFGLVGNMQITMRNFDILDWPGSFYEIPDAWTGAGQTLHLVARPGTRFSRYRVTFIEPYIFDTRNSLSLTFQSLDILRDDWEEGRTEFAPRVIHHFDFDRDLSFSIGARAAEVEVTDVEPNAPRDAFDAEGTTTILGLNAGMEYDKVLIEPFEGPYDGHREGFTYNYVGGFLGGHVDYHSVQMYQDLYFPLYTHLEGNYHHVIAWKGRFGFMKPFDNTKEIPIFERFFLGGPADVKGFRYRGLGPHSRGEPIGGTAELWGTLEYSFPIFEKLLRGVVFLDYGNLSELTDFKMDRMRYSAGGGFRINFPFLGGQPLPIGLYFGKPIQQEDFDEERLFLFTIGDTF